MSLQDRKITDWTQSVSSLDDRPQMTATALKAAFDSNTNQIKPALNGVIDDLIGTGGAGDIGLSPIMGVAATNVQLALEVLKNLIDLCDTSEDSDEKLALKADKTTTDKLVKTITFDADTGVFTIKTDDGTTTTIDTLLEKVPINCYLDGQEFVLVLQDGTEQRVDISAFLTTTEFTDSATIDFGVSGSTVTASVKNGSITLQMLESTVLTTIQGYVSAAQTAAGNAAASETDAGTYAGQAQTAKTEAQTAASEADSHATEAESWAVGGTGTRTGEDTNNAKYFAEQAAGASQIAHGYADYAQGYADSAEASAGEAEQAATGAANAVKTQLAGYVMNAEDAAIRAEQAAEDAEAIAGGDFIPTSQKGVAKGVATLDGTGKVPSTQLPSMDYIPTSQKGAASGVASLGADGKLEASQKPEYTADEVGAAAPEDIPGIVIVKATGDDDPLTSSMSASQVYDAFSAGKAVLLVVKSYSNYTGVYTLVDATSSTATFCKAPKGSNYTYRVSFRYMQLTGTTLVPYPDLNLAGAPTTTPEEGQVLMAGANGNNVWADAPKPKMHRVYLTASGWSNNSQTVEVEGVSADEDEQIITAAPAAASQDGYYGAGVLMTAQAADSITFSCDSVPDSNLTVYVSVQEATPPPPIYGVLWDGTSTTALSRTNDAVDFDDPVPAVNNGNGSSPFDNLMPWSGMTRVTDEDAGELVAIPKYWYKWTKSGNAIGLQISPEPVAGFAVSPAHCDRGDGHGERDVVYVGRYHCASGYKSQTGVKPLASITRSTARSGIHNLGGTIWQWDWAMSWTIKMLYLVEYADWNSQAKIGYGCGNGSSTENMGATDDMTYHTGTSKSSRTTYGVGVQYRHIEGLWDNVYDWVDGCRNDSNGLSIILNPSNFSDSSGGTSIGTPSSAYPSALDVKTALNGMWIIPTAASGSDSTYVPDRWNFLPDGLCLRLGGSYTRAQGHGLFYVYCNTAYYSLNSIGTRLMKLP